MSFEFNSSTSLSSNSQVFDFEGLEESLVDNELNESLIDDCIESEEYINDCDVNNCHDVHHENHVFGNFHAIREALIRDSTNRTDEDVETILRFLTVITQKNRKNSLLSRDFHTRRQLARHFVLAEIESRDTRVLTNGERLDAYCVVAYGSLRHTFHDPNCEEVKARYLCVGDEFGASFDDRVVFGEIFTNEDFVWVLCVPHTIFDEICGEKAFKIIRDEISGKIIEIRSYNHELLRATRDRLFELLFSQSPNDSEADNIFINDFLLTFRIWATNDCDVIKELMQKIIQNLVKDKNVEKNIKIVLQWISNHFQDFTRDNNNKQLLKDFEMNLKSKMHKKLFYLALSSKSRERHVTLTRSDREKCLPFTLIGGYECSSRLFISDVSDDCDADLQRGDRLISINGIDCHVMEVSRALDLCKSCTHLSFVLKYDPNLYHLLIDGQISRNSETKRHLSQQNLTAVPPPNSCRQQLSVQSLTNTNNNSNNNWKQKVLQIVHNVATNQIKMSTNHINGNNNNNAVINNITTATPNMTFGHSSAATTTPEVIKIYYESDFRYLPIHVTTTARECIQLALIEFQLNTNYCSRDFALYEYKLLDKTTATSAVKRLSDNYQNLAKNLSLNSRIYLKLISGNQLNESEITREIAREISVNSLLTLDSEVIARELTARDFELFCLIESQQFVYDLSREEKKVKELKEFESKTNDEMFWTINQILISGNSQQKRVKTIKQLIRIASICKELQNFNSLFAILSGLSHLSITRLKNLWEKIPQKSMNKLEKLQQLMDPSRNFQNFRQKLKELFPPIIPFFPLVKKDLSFIYLANQTFIQTEESDPQILINWEKMKLLAQKIRETVIMTNSSLETNPSESHVTTNYKKIWEKQRMKKRVQHFLDKSFSEIISDENQLLIKSIECEPTAASSAQQLMTRSSISASSVTSSQTTSSSQSTQPEVMPSPTPSSHSSSPSLSSSTTNSSECQTSSRVRLRFGVRDDNGLRKLLALSDNCVSIPPNNHISIATNHNFINSNPINSNSQVARVVNTNTRAVSQSLPQESSSVTSLRRLEQMQQLSRFREQLIPCPERYSRPLLPLPSYDQTIQRMRKRFQKSSEENIV